MIETLEWDSDFFKTKIGKFVADVKNIKLLSEKALNEFDLVYIFSPSKLNLDLKLMDIKITLAKYTKKHQPISDISEYNPSTDNYQELLNLVYLSGHDSRFLKDPFFGKKKFQQLYQKWIDNSINDVNAKVLIYKINKNIAGFVSFKKQKQQAVIELIAVSPYFQGNKVGQHLLNAVENSLKAEALLRVATQETNLQACRFYEKYGFERINKQYIYHYLSKK